MINLNACLLQDGLRRTRRQVSLRVRYRDQAGLDRVPELVMITFGARSFPTIRKQQPDHLPAVLECVLYTLMLEEATPILGTLAASTSSI